MSKLTICFALMQIICGTGFSQSLSLIKLGETFRRTNLEVRWNVPTNALPGTVWVYHLLPRWFPPEAVSNLVASCGFTERDKKISSADEVVYKNANKFPSKQLGISRFQGSIYFEDNSVHYSATNLAKDVPIMSQMPELTTNFLLALGINPSEIEKNADGIPNFHFWEPFTQYYVGNTSVTNIQFRAVSFRRSVDGGTFLGGGTGGDGLIKFGEHGKIVHMDISWRNIERFKSYPAATPEQIVKWICEGKAVLSPIPDNVPPIDWQTVKSATIKRVVLAHYAGDRFKPSDSLMPLVSLLTTVDTGNGSIDVEIECPIIDESK